MNFHLWPNKKAAPQTKSHQKSIIQNSSKIENSSKLQAIFAPFAILYSKNWKKQSNFPMQNKIKIKKN